MKKILVCLLSLLLVACTSNSNVESNVETPSTTEETVEVNSLKVLAPKGATAVGVSILSYEGFHDVTYVDGADVLQASLVNPEPEYDVIIAPSNLGIKLAVAGKSQYKIADVLTWGNLFLVGTTDEINEDTRIALFGENAVVGLVYEDLFADSVGEKTYYGAVTEAQAALLSDNADVALLAEPAATATIAKAKENGKELKVIADLQTLWQDKYGDSYPQAAIFVLSSTYENDPASVDSLINTVKTFIDNTNADKAELANIIDTVTAEELGVPSSAIVEKVWDRLNLNVKDASECVEQLNNFMKLFGVEDSSSALLK